MLEGIYPHKERVGEKFKLKFESLKKEILRWRKPPNQKPREKTLRWKKSLEFQDHKLSCFDEEERQKSRSGGGGRRG
jgi:hypothetical protein